MDELIRVLEKTVSNLQSDQNEAFRFIEEYMKRDLTGFLKALSEVLYCQQNPPIVRTAAGLQLKNQLTARDDNIRIRYQERWRSLPDETRRYIKERIFRTLGTEICRPYSSPQCVAYIAVAELNEAEWPSFIEALVQNTKSSPDDTKLKLATLEAIGYVCQEITSSEQQNNKKREITNGLNSSMATIYSYIGDCVSSQNYDLMTTALQCLSGLLSWAQSNDNLLRYLCQLLRNYELLPPQVPHEFSEQKSAIMSSTCECLNVCLERKHPKPDSIEIRTSLYEDEGNLHSIISTLGQLNRLSHQQPQQDPQPISEVIKKLSQVLTNILRYVYLGPPEKPQNLLDMFAVMELIVRHPSISVSLEGIRFWNRFFAVSPKRPNPSFSNELVASLLITCANKLIKANYDTLLYGYEFDCQEEFETFQSKYRCEIHELCRHLTCQNDQTCFELVSNSIAKSLQERNINLNEWEALSSLTSAVCSKLKDPNLYLMNGVELVRALMLSMESALVQAASIPPESGGTDAGLIPQLVSYQLSCVSALYVFLPYWHRNDKQLTKDLLSKVISYAFHRPDKFTSSSRQLAGNNTNLLTNEAFLKGFRILSRHASASFVRACLNHSKHLVDIFLYLKSSVDCLFATVVDNPYSSEKCQLYEGLTLICNHQSDEVAKKKFVLELFESVEWFKEYELNCDQFIEFVGFNRLEVDQDAMNSQNMISQQMSPSQINRMKLTYVITFLGSIARRLDSRSTLLPEVLSFIRPILNIIFTMNALWMPEMKTKCLEEYRQFLFAPFNSTYKQQTLDVLLVNQKTGSSDINSLSSSYEINALGDLTVKPSKGNGQYIELFSWNFYETLLSTMGTMITKTSPELYSFINSMQLQTALTGAEYLPPLKMHKLIKNFIMPLVNTCSKNQHLIETQLLPLLSKLLPFLFDMLDRQWKKNLEDDSNVINGTSGKVDQSQTLADEMVRDQLLRNLSRDFIDLMNMILVESVPPQDTNLNNNSATLQSQQSNKTPNSIGQKSGNRQQQQETHKIGMLGLNLLATGPDFIMKVMASTLTWSDSTLNAKAIFINQQLIKHILTSNPSKSIDEISIWLGCMFGSVITSLRKFGEHEQNCSGLLTLFLYLYENLRTTPNFHDHLERMTGISKSAFEKYDQDSLKANEKNKRASLRRALDSLVQKQ